MHREQLQIGHSVRLQVDVTQETKGHIFLLRKVKTLVFMAYTYCSIYKLRTYVGYNIDKSHTYTIYHTDRSLTCWVFVGT
jgi:hypothetical protein